MVTELDLYLKMKIISLLLISSFLLLTINPGVAKIEKKLIRVAYYGNMFGHIHRNPSRYSTSMTTVACGHPVKIYSVNKGTGGNKVFFNKVWNFVKIGPYEGYIRKDYLASKRPKCFQDRYPKFFDNLEIDLSELYYWGRLYDHYFTGKSRVR